MELRSRKKINDFFVSVWEKAVLRRRGKLLGGGRFIMCFMTAVSSVAGGALTSKTAIVFGFGHHKDGLLAKS